MAKRTQSPKTSPRQWAQQLFAQPSKALYQKPVLYMSGNELELQNFRAVVDYTSEGLLIDMGRGRLTIQGDDLVILALEKGRLVLRGHVLDISFSDE